MISDVVTIFLTLGERPDHRGLIVENATAFGPREQVSGNYVIVLIMKRQRAVVLRNLRIRNPIL